MSTQENFTVILRDHTTIKGRQRAVVMHGILDVPGYSQASLQISTPPG